MGLEVLCLDSMFANCGCKSFGHAALESSTLWDATGPVSM